MSKCHLKKCLLNFDKQKSWWNDYTIFLEQCFGGFAIGVREDENGNLIQVCYCKGQQCSNYLLWIW